MLTSEQYLQQFQQGAHTGLQYFFRQYYAPLCLYGQRLSGDAGFAAEMASEAFVQTWRQRAQFMSAGAVKGYLYTVVKNGCHKWLLKKNRELGIDYSLLQQTERTAQEAMIFTETIRNLYLRLSQLPRQCSAVMHALYVEGKTMAETARDLNMSLSTVKTHKRIGLDALRRGLLLLLLYLLVFYK